MPILTGPVPHKNKFYRAEKIMNPNVVSLNCVDTVENIYDQIKNSGHHGFPIVNKSNRAVGLIFSNYLLVLIKNKKFYDKQVAEQK